VHPNSHVEAVVPTAIPSRPRLALALCLAAFAAAAAFAATLTNDRYQFDIATDGAVTIRTADAPPQLLQPEFAERLGGDKAEAIAASGANIAVSANIGCIKQLQGKLAVAGGDLSPIPILHLAQILDWATGGERPAVLGTDNAQARD
jgi:hypothetical protein